MAKFTAYVVLAFGHENVTQEDNALIEFHKYTDAETAKKAISRLVEERIPKHKYSDRWVFIQRLPREMFEEVLADMGDLSTLADLNDGPDGLVAQKPETWDEFIE